MMQKRVFEQPSEAKRISQTISSQALAETVKAYSAAMQRTGTTPETRMVWLLNFLYQDADMLSRGDLLNISDEIRVYASPLKTGYYVFDTKASPLSPKKIKNLQSRLLHDLQNVLAGIPVRTNPRIAYAGCATPNTKEFQLARIGDLLDLVRLGLFLDIEQLGLARIRRCERGTPPYGGELHSTPCGKLFYASDLRQRFCSPACGKEVRWKRYWKDKGEEIKRKRRKGGV